VFSILVASYNGAQWITEALKSIQDQTFHDFECIILDNGSTDDTKEIISPFIENDSRFQYHYLDVANKANALNYGIMIAKNEWLAICDIDDLWTNDKLEKQRQFILDNPEVDFVGARFKYFGYGENLESKTPALPLTHDEICIWLDRCENPLATSATVYRKDVHFRGVGFYNTMYYSVEDYEIWKKGKMRGMKFANIDSICMLHRIHPPSPFQTTNRQEISKAIVDVLFTDLTDVRRITYFTELLQRFDKNRPKGDWSDGHSVRGQDK